MRPGGGLMGASYPLPPVPRLRPIGVTILAVLTILAGIIFLLIGVVIVAFSVVAAALFSSFIGGLGAIAGAILLVVGIIGLVAGSVPPPPRRAAAWRWGTALLLPPLRPPAPLGPRTAVELRLP